MTRQDLDQRIAAVKRERARGFYVDALELEVVLYRDIANDVPGACGPRLAWVLRDQRMQRAVSELTP